MGHLSWDEVWSVVDGEAASHNRNLVAHLQHCTECQERVLVVRMSNQAIVEAMRAPTSAHSSVAGSKDGEKTVRKSQLSHGTWKQALRRRTVSVTVAAAAVVVAVVAGKVAFDGHASSSNRTFSYLTHDAANGAAKMSQLNASNSMSTMQASATTTADVNGTLQLAVKNRQGKPLGGVQVAVVTDGQVRHLGQTNAQGQLRSTSIYLSINPLLLPSFNAVFPAYSTPTVVLWKTGYQTAVLFDTPFKAGDNTLDVTLFAPSPDTPLTLQDTTINSLYAGNFVNWVDGHLPHDAMSSRQTSDVTLDVHVTDEHGQSLQGALVALVSLQGVTTSATSSSDGSASVMGPARSDERYAVSGLAPSKGGKVVCLVVSKTGYAPYLDMYQDVGAGTTTVDVQLQSLQWRQNNGDAEPDAPITPLSLPTSSALQPFVQAVESSAP